MKQNLIRKTIRKVSHIAKSKFDFAKLKKANSKVSLISEIILDIQKDRWTNAEKESFHKINNLRKFYAENQNEIRMIDFGAGQAMDNRTEDEMRNGVEITKIISSVYKKASTPHKQGEFMFKIIRTFRPKVCVELGTCLGISAAYGIEALRLNNDKGEYLTIEGSPELANLSANSLKAHGFENVSIMQGRFEDILPAIFDKYKEIDFVYIDGHHEEKATIMYFNKFYDYLSPQALILFDDINWSKGMLRAWNSIKDDSRVSWTVDNFDRGICFVDKDARKTNEDYKIWL